MRIRKLLFSTDVIRNRKGMNVFLTKFESSVIRDQDKYATADEEVINKTLDEFHNQNDDPIKRKEAIAVLVKLFRRKVQIDQKEGKPVIAQELKIHPKLLYLVRRDLPDFIADVNKLVGTRMGGMSVDEYISIVYEEYRYRTKLEALDELGHIKIEEFEWRMMQTPEFLNRLHPHDVHMIFRSFWRNDVDTLIKECKLVGLEKVKQIDPDLLKCWPRSVLHALHPELQAWVEKRSSIVFWSDNYKLVGLICLFVIISAYGAYFIVSKIFKLKPPKYTRPVDGLNLPSKEPEYDEDGIEITQEEEEDEDDEDEDEEEDEEDDEEASPTPITALLSFLIVQVILFGILVGIFMGLVSSRSIVWISRGIEMYEMMLIYLAYVFTSVIIFLLTAGVDWMKPILFGMDNMEVNQKDPNGGISKMHLYNFFQLNLIVICSICTTYVFLPIVTHMSRRLLSAQIKERIKDQ
jgi:hypothetical protein